MIKLSRVAVSGGELPYPPPPAALGELFYVATLALDKKTVLAYGKEEPLRPGMGVDANLILASRNGSSMTSWSPAMRTCSRS